MKSKTLISKGTIFSRILLFNIILAVFVTLLSQSINYSYFMKLYNREVSRHNMQIVKQIRRSIDERIIENIINIPNVYLSPLSSNEDLTYPLSNDITRDSIRIVNVSKKLSDIKNTVDFIDSIDIYYSKGHVIFIDSKVNFLDDLACNKQYKPDWFNEINKMNLNVYWIPTRHIDLPQARYATSYIRTIPYFTDKKEMQAVVAIHIKEEALKKYISDITDTEIHNEKVEFFIIDNEGNFILSENKDQYSKTKDEILASKEYEQYMSKVLSTNKEGIFNTKIDGKLSVVTFEKSKYNNWNYVFITSIDSFYEASRRVKHIFAVIGILLLMLSLLVSIFFAKRAHKPFGKIIKKANDISVTINNDQNIQNEYVLLMNTINNLAFKVEDLHNRLEVNKPIIKHNIILKLLKGEINSEHSALKDKFFDIGFDKDNVFCFVIKTYSDDKLSFQNKMLIEYNLIDLLQKNNKHWKVKAISNEDNFICGIVNHDCTHSIEQIVNTITSVIETLLNTKYVICVGNDYCITDDKISQSYNEALECLEYTFLKTKEKILFYEKLHIHSLKETGSAYKILNKIADSIRAGEGDNLRFAIESIIESLIVGDYTVDYARNTLTDIVSTIRNTLKEIGYSSKNLFGYNIREYAKTLDSIEDFRKWVNEIINIILTTVESRRQNIDKYIESKIKEYIEENIYNDISLDKTADEFNIRRDSLSKIFKKSTGITFTSYVKKVKLTCAVKLLKENKLSVGEIASKLGYNSTQYFIKLFKQKYGYTPKNYQKIKFIDDNN